MIGLHHNRTRSKLAQDAMNPPPLTLASRAQIGTSLKSRFAVLPPWAVHGRGQLRGSSESEACVFDDCGAEGPERGPCAVHAREGRERGGTPAAPSAPSGLPYVEGGLIRLAKHITNGMRTIRALFWPVLLATVSTLAQGAPSGNYTTVSSAALPL